MNFLDFDSEMKVNQIKHSTLDTVISTGSAKPCYDRHKRVHNIDYPYTCRNNRYIYLLILQRFYLWVKA